MTTPLTPEQAEIQKLIGEWEQLMTDFPFAWRVCKESTTPDQHHEKCSWRTDSMLCDCAADKAFAYTVDTFRKYTQPIAAYIRTLEKIIERAEYEGAMARGEFMHLRIEDGLSRLDRSLNILKFKDPEHSSLTIQ